MARTVIDRRTLIAGMASGIIVSAEATSCSAAPVHNGVVLDLAEFGVSPGATPQENLSGFKKAISHAPPGAMLHLRPTAPLACRIEVGGDWSTAITIDRPVILRIDGDLQASHAGAPPASSFMLNITAPGVTITGTGRIIGSGAIDDGNSGTDETFPGLIRVSADNFVMTEIELVTPPKVGLMLYQCRKAKIVRARFSGGPKVYGDTGYFAIRAAGGGEHLFDTNRFYPAEDGGMFVQCIMLGGSHDNLFTGNHARYPYEKLIYGYGDRNVAKDNIVIGNPGYIPGTNIQGTITSVFRFHGSFNTVQNNHAHGCAGGAQMMDGRAHIVVDNEFLSCGQSAISAYRGNISGSTFRRNVGTRADLAGFVAGDGIRIVSDDAASGIVVENNRISGFSTPDPIATLAVWRGRTSFGRNSLVRPRAGNGRFYMAQGTGVSATNEPRWPAAPGETVVDGTVTWVTIAYEGGQAGLKLYGSSAAAPITGSTISGNRIDGGRYGIVTRFVTHSRIVGNILDASEWGMVEDAGSHNIWKSNDIRGTASRQVQNLASTSSMLSDR